MASQKKMLEDHLRRLLGEKAGKAASRAAMLELSKSSSKPRIERDISGSIFSTRPTSGVRPPKK